MLTVIINLDVLTRTGEKNIEWLRSLFLDRWLDYNLSSHCRISKQRGVEEMVGATVTGPIKPKARLLEAGLSRLAEPFSLAVNCSLASGVEKFLVVITQPRVSYACASWPPRQLSLFQAEASSLALAPSELAVGSRRCAPAQVLEC